MAGSPLADYDHWERCIAGEPLPTCLTQLRHVRQAAAVVGVALPATAVDGVVVHPPAPVSGGIPAAAPPPPRPAPARSVPVVRPPAPVPRPDPPPARPARFARLRAVLAALRRWGWG